MCFACGLKVNQWDKDVNPWKEHKRLSPVCRFSKMIGYGEVGNVENNSARDTLLFGYDIDNNGTETIQQSPSPPMYGHSYLWNKT